MDVDSEQVFCHVFALVIGTVVICFETVDSHGALPLLCWWTVVIIVVGHG